MTLNQFFKKNFFSILVCIFCNVTTNYVIAQTSNTQSVPTPQTYGAWTKICSFPPGTPNVQCEIVQDVRAQKRRDITFRIVFYKLPQNKEVLMRVFVPIRVELQPGIVIKIDDKDLGRMEYRRCLGNNCVAETLLKENVVKLFLEGKLATYIIFTTPEQGIGGVVDLNGLNDAYATL
ncbi:MULTISPECIES: invasion associated locus B family protein [unclassified Bartonella]|uniref:invasion associated locus B family protein n=1 Tax=unclassified Bartonella TaxID=2645622 RepID=UPI000999BB4B|nr:MULTISPECIES: invasion associated locus B family protein [unclassified Bartonella]AQX27702.1 Invasion protein IalB, involved in pathogenesis [Bartonella sp. JB15]AQX28983.1 Invasion protein IalB, involved in pathogenesis [Bartonella sp. JB63]